MKRILLTGNLFLDYDVDIYIAIQQLGYDVDILFNNEIDGPYNKLVNFHKKLIYGIFPQKLKINYFFEKSVNEYNDKLLKLIKNNYYNLMLVIGGKTIQSRVLEKVSFPKVLWFMDGIERFPAVLNKLKYFNSIFCFEPTDLLVDKVKAIDCHYLSLGFNPSKFFPIHGKNKPYDLTFIGAYYPNRDILLSTLEKLSCDVKIIGDFYRSKNKYITGNVLKRQIKPIEVNLFYNQSLININIHHPQSKEGLNVRTFEIQGSGNLQIVERQKIAQKLFKEDHNIMMYSCQEEFLDKINFLLKNRNYSEKISKAAFFDAIENHTWKERVKEMFKILKKSKLL